MAGKFWLWSQTAASNATADSSVNWAEGQAPSSVNDSARAMMAAIASYRADASGSLLVGGTSTAYTLTTNQAFASTSDMDGQEISFIVTPTNGANPTLNVNSLGAFPLYTTGGVAIAVGALNDGGIYTVTFSNSGSYFKLRDFYTKPHETPIGGMIDYPGSTVPNANWMFPNGAAISRTTYAALFALLGTTYGVGDGSTTFNLPDYRGYVTAMKEASATRLTSTFFGGDSTVLGATGGLESAPLSLAQLPTGITSVNGAQSITVTFGVNLASTGGTIGTNTYTGSGGTNIPNSTASWAATTSSAATNNSISVTSNNTSGASHKNVQPTIIVNKIMRVL